MSAQVIHTKETEVAQSSFTISTAHSDLSFKADSATSAKEWVKQIQSVIFRLQNGGDSIKITLPARNILDLENNPVLDAADTFRFRVIDNDETYAVDEVRHSFPALQRDVLTSASIFLHSLDVGQPHCVIYVP